MYNISDSEMTLPKYKRNELNLMQSRYSEMRKAKQGKNEIKMMSIMEKVMWNEVM